MRITPGRAALLATGATAGATSVYLFDRRRRIVERAVRMLPRPLRRRITSPGVAGGTRRAKPVVDHEKHPDDFTLANKVRSEAFRRSHIPKGAISVDVSEGVVTLRGALARPELIAEAERHVRSVEGVRGVRNLLHVAGTPAPARP